MKKLLILAINLIVNIEKRPNLAAFVIHTHMLHVHNVT